MEIVGLDHVVLTVKNIHRTVKFYSEVLGMRLSSSAGSRKALLFGQQKINLHQAGKEFEPKARQPTPGSADLCFVADTPMEDVIAHLSHCDIEIVEGPVARTGAVGPITSVYLFDPDGNLVEVANYDPSL